MVRKNLENMYFPHNGEDEETRLPQSEIYRKKVIHLLASVASGIYPMPGYLGTRSVRGREPQVVIHFEKNRVVKKILIHRNMHQMSGNQKKKKKRKKYSKIF